MADEKPVVGIIMGSKSDMPAMEPCMQQLDEFGISYEVKVASAHRVCFHGKRKRPMQAPATPCRIVLGAAH